MKSPSAPPPIRSVAVLGAAGVVGASWCALFAHYGLEVRAQDPAPGLEERVRSFAARAEAALRALAPDAGPAGRITFHSDLAEAATDVDWAQECAPERADVKRGLLAGLDRVMPPEAIIASSTSALLRSDIAAECTRHPERVIVAHPFNPPHLLPLVELVGLTPDAPAVLRAAAWLRGLGKHPVILRRETVGHIANRLNSSIYREAVSLVEQGIASVEDVDAAMVHGPGARWAVLGPHLLYHLGGGPGGIRHYLAHLGPSQVRRWADLRTPELTEGLQAQLIEGVEESARGRTIGELEAERDAAILALLLARRTET